MITSDHSTLELDYFFQKHLIQNRISCTLSLSVAYLNIPMFYLTMEQRYRLSREHIWRYHENDGYFKIKISTKFTNPKVFTIASIVCDFQFNMYSDINNYELMINYFSALPSQAMDVIDREHRK